MNQSTADWFALSQGAVSNDAEKELAVALELSQGVDYDQLGKLVFSDVQVAPTSSAA